MTKRRNCRRVLAPLYGPSKREPLITKGTRVLICAPSKYAGQKGEVTITDTNFARVKLEGPLLRWVRLTELRVDRSA